MGLKEPSATLTEKLRRSRKTLERQISEGSASCDTRETLDRLADLEKRDDSQNDSLIQRGDA